MSKINWLRVLLGGLVATVVNLVFALAANSRLALGLLHDTETKALAAVPPQNLQFLWPVYMLLGGVALVWLYAVARPRFGTGPISAVKSACVFWIIGVALPNFENVLAGRFSVELMVVGSLFALLGLVFASIAGAAVYKEP